MTEKLIRILVVAFGLSFFYSLFMWSKEEIKVEKQSIEISNLKLEVGRLTNLSDSIQNEKFELQLMVGRYDVALQILGERNPKAASQFNDIISKETE